MDVAVGATIAAVAKKALAILLGDKKGRKFLLYVVGIALFIVCIPLITLIGMFGWMAGDGGTILNKDMVLSNLPQEQQQQIATMDATCDTIVSVFKTKELDTGDQRKASAIYISYLVGMESGDTFYDDLANCFLNTTADKDVYDLVSETFLVVVSEEDQTKMDQLYGVTPTRVTEETTGEEEVSYTDFHMKGEPNDERKEEAHR